MKTITKTTLVALIGAATLTSSLNAGEPSPAITTRPDIDPSSYLCACDCDCEGVHAPIGVMGDHTHAAGEFMLSYRWMYMSMDGHRAGNDALSTQQVYDRGFGAAAVEMEMQMHMIGAMFAPTDWLTLMAMTNYVEKDMTLQANPHAHGHGHGGGHTGTFRHSSSGWGDTTVGALVKIFDTAGQRAHLNLAFTLPTAEVDQKQDGVFLPYGMQLGSGTWDFKPGVTYLGQNGNLSWGAQVGGTIRLEDANDSGFAYGDGVHATPWLAYCLSDSLSVSGRLNYTWEDEIEGHYNGPHGHVAPPHFQENFGGHILEGGVGLNWYFQTSFLKGHRLAAEVLVPMYQDLNGVGMDRDYSVVVGWQKAF